MVCDIIWESEPAPGLKKWRKQKRQRKGAAVQGKDQKEEKSKVCIYRKEHADQEESCRKTAESTQK